MTVYFNVTDAIGGGPTHGITRTERRLAEALADRGDVSFVAVHRGELRGVDPDEMRPLLSSALGSTDGLAPRVEVFGVDPVPAPNRVPRLGARLRAAAGTAQTIEYRPVQPSRGSTLVSAGLDWTHGFVDVARRHVHGSGGRYVGFCYDLIPAEHPEWLFPADPSGFRRHLVRLADTADRIVCISDHTRRGLLRAVPDLDPERVTVIRLGADASAVIDGRHRSFAATLFGGAPYAIYCATVDRRKNHELLARVAATWASDGRPGNLVFVGRLGSGVSDLIDCLRHDPQIRGRIAHVSECDDSHLGALYERAAVAVHPSLAEGWGLGVTEALAHGTPCIVASGSSLEEAGLGVCEVVDPFATRRWADRIAAHLDSPRPAPVVELPTWAGAADELLAVVAE